MRIATVAVLNARFSRTRRVRSNAPEVFAIIERNYALARDVAITGTPASLDLTRVVRVE